MVKILEKYHYDKTIALKSKTWFEQQMILLRKQNIDKKRLFREGKQVSSIIPGKLYMFMYDPKHKETLPYYDTFPLVFPYAKTQDGFIGLNMHYLPNFYRIKMMNALLQYKSSKDMNENTRIKYSWDLIKGISKFAFAKNCIKQYLNENVESSFIDVNAKDWYTVMMLPTERFVGANKTNVWKDSITI